MGKHKGEKLSQRKKVKDIITSFLLSSLLLASLAGCSSTKSIEGSMSNASDISEAHSDLAVEAELSSAVESDTSTQSLSRTQYGMDSSLPENPEKEESNNIEETVSESTETATMTTSDEKDTAGIASKSNIGSDVETNSEEKTENTLSCVTEKTKESSLGTTTVETGEIPQQKKIIIVLDPGHSSVVTGQTEPLGPGSTEMKAADTIGTHGDASGLMEYELNLLVCRKLAVALQQNGYSVIMTRQDSDSPLTNVQRAQIANEAQADIFLRVHANGSDSSSVSGAMTLCISKENSFTPDTYEESSRLSEILLDEYCIATGRRKERVWYTDNMTGLNWSKVPSTLLEMGYMTNSDEDLWMASDEGQQQIVTGIVNGLNQYLRGE